MRDNTRVRRYPINKSLLLDLFTQGQKINAEIVHGIPKDSIIVHQAFDREFGMFWFMVQNESFEPVAQGAVVPIEVIQVRQELPAKLVDAGGFLEVQVYGVPVAFVTSDADATTRERVEKIADRINTAYLGRSQTPDTAPALTEPVKPTETKPENVVEFPQAKLSAEVQA